MRPVRRLLTGLLATALIGWAVGSTLNATVFDRGYVTASAETSGLYAGVAAALPGALSATTGGAVPSSALAVLITPQAVQDRLEGVIGGTARAWELGRRAPGLDLTDVATQVTDLGLPLPPAVAGLLETSRVLTSPAFDRAAGAVAAASRLAGGLAPRAAGVLALMVVIVAGRHRWANLAGAALSAAILIVMAAAVAWLAPGTLTASLATSNWAALAAPVQGYLTELARGVVGRLLWWGGGLSVIAAVLLVAPSVVGRSRRRHAAEKTASAERR